MTARWLAFVALLVPRVASAEIGERPKPDTGPNAIGTAVGIDGAILTWSLTYARGLELPIDRQLVLRSTVSLPMTRPDLGDWRWSAGARINALRWRRFEWPVAVDVLARGLSNRALRAHGIGTVVSTMPGYYPSRWFIAADLSWDQQWGTYVRHSDAYRRIVYADVADGWYRTTGHTLRAGARVGGRPWRRMELWLRAGYERHGRHNRLAPPLYALLGLDVRF